MDAGVVAEMVVELVGIDHEIRTRVIVASTISSHPAMVADELRRQADVFTDLVDLKTELCRNPAERVARGTARIAQREPVDV